MKKITAAGLMAKLNSDPEFVAKRARDEEERRRREAEYRVAEAPLVEQLRDAGFQLHSVWDLVNTSTPYLKALPILVRHLSLSYPPAVREGIARSLAVPEAKDVAWETLTRLYREEPALRVKSGLAAAIATAADDDTIGELIALVRDPTHGASRLLLLSALERSGDPRADLALKELSRDPELSKEIQVILRRKRRKR
jgi:hypothetical protein